MKMKVAVCLITALLLSGCTAREDGNGARAVSSDSHRLETEAPLEILATAMSTARTKGSAHVVSVAKLGSKAFKIEGDIASDHGTQTLTVGNASSEIRFVEGIAYVRSNAEALTEVYGFPSGIASRYAQKWLAFTSEDRLYSGISRGLTVDSMIQDLSISGPLTKGSLRMIGRVQTIGVSGKTAEGDAATLFVAIESEPLPVQMLITRGHETATIDFSAWGKPIAVTAPSSATRASDLAA